MENFKVIFPSGYFINNYLDDNLDLNIVLPNGNVFFSTFFTIYNIKRLLEEEHSQYFWSTDMIVIDNLKKETIKHVVSNLIVEGYLETACSNIGQINEVFPNIKLYSDLTCEI